MNFKTLKAHLNVGLSEDEIKNTVDKAFDLNVLTEAELEDVSAIKSKINWRSLNQTKQETEPPFIIMHSKAFKGKTYTYNDVQGLIPLSSLGLPKNFYGGNVTGVGRNTELEKDNAFLLIENNGRVLDIIAFTDNPINSEKNKTIKKDLDKTIVTKEFLDACHTGGGYYTHENITARGKKTFISVLIETGNYILDKNLEKGGE